jgi:hypothetical protein
MAVFLLRQPDGKLAAFSTVCDDFTHYDLTEGEAIDAVVERCGRMEAEAKLHRALNDDVMDGPRDAADGLYRWRIALRDCGRQHGLEHLKNVLREIGFAEYEIPKSVMDVIERSRSEN